MTRFNARYGKFVPTSLITLLALTLAAPAYAANEDPLFYPLMRYAIPEKGDPTTEYIGESDGPFADKFVDSPPAAGPMVLDCQAVEEVGLVIEPLGVGGWIYGAKRKFRFEWTHSSPDVKSKKWLQYKRNTPQGYMRNRLKLKKFKVDGTITATISVEGNVIHTETFEIQNCGDKG